MRDIFAQLATREKTLPGRRTTTTDLSWRRRNEINGSWARHSRRPKKHKVRRVPIPLSERFWLMTIRKWQKDTLEEQAVNTPKSNAPVISVSPPLLAPRYTLLWN